MTRLNLGCGRRPLPGYTNVDRNPGPGVDIVCDLDREPLPFGDGSVDEVVSSHFLEHVFDFEHVMREIGRVLRAAGRMTARVPYGFNCNPYHRRYFDRASVRRIVAPDGCTDADPDDWRVVSVRVEPSGFPFWHVRRHLRLNLWPLARRKELVFVLERVR